MVGTDVFIRFHDRSRLIGGLLGPDLLVGFLGAGRAVFEGALVGLLDARDTRVDSMGLTAR